MIRLYSLDAEAQAAMGSGEKPVRKAEQLEARGNDEGWVRQPLQRSNHLLPSNRPRVIKLSDFFSKGSCNLCHLCEILAIIFPFFKFLNEDNLDQL